MKLLQCDTLIYFVDIYIYIYIISIYVYIYLVPVCSALVVGTGGPTLSLC